MAIFEYTGYDKTGKAAKGIIQAPSTGDAMDRLSRSGILVAGTKEIESGNIRFLPNGEVAAFAREMASYVRAGSPVTEALASLVQGRGTSRLALAAAMMVDMVEAGLELSAAMERSGCFPGLAMEIVASGEGRGALGQALLECADIYKNKTKLSGRIVASMAYPAFLAIATAGTGFFLLNRVIPVLAKVYAEMKIPLPLPTRIVVQAAGIANSKWAVAVFVVVAAITWRMAGRGNCSRFFDSRAAESIPLIGRVVILDRTARAMRAMSGMLKGGAKLDSALMSAARVAGNGKVAIALRSAASAMAHGIEISAAMAADGGMPREAIHLMRAGERSGDLVQAAERAAELFESEAASATEALASLVEPVMVAIAGAIAGFLVIASLLPMFRMNMLGL